MNKETFNRLKKVNDIFSEIDFTYHEIARKSGLSDSEFNILYTLCELGNGCLLSLAYKHNGTSRQTIESAVRKLEKNELIKSVLGSYACERYTMAKKQEWEQYCRHVSNWELEQYLHRI